MSHHFPRELSLCAVNELLYFFFLFFPLPLDLRYRELTYLYSLMQDTLLSSVQGLFVLKMYLFLLLFQFLLELSLKIPPFSSALPKCPGNYSFQVRLTLRFHFIVCRWEALIKRLVGKVDATVISLLPFLTCGHQGFMRFYSIFCISCELSNDFSLFLTWLTDTSYYSES